MLRFVSFTIVLGLTLFSTTSYSQEIDQELIKQASGEICSCIEEYPMATITSSYTETIRECFVEYFTRNESILDNYTDEFTTEEEMTKIGENLGLKVGLDLRTSCPVVVSMNNKTGDKLFEKLLEGNSLLETEGCAAANEVYTEVISNVQTPDSTKATALLNRGFCKNELGDYYGAIGDLSNTLALAPNTPLAYQIMGSAKRYLGNYDNAISDLNKAISLNEDVPEYYNERGLSYYYKEQPDLAIKDYQKAISLDSTNATFHFNLGLVFNYLEEYQDALQAFITVYELNPTITDLSYYTINAYQGLELYEDAIGVLLEDTLTASDPYNLHEIGMSYYYMEQYGNAILYFTKAIGIDSTQYSPYLYRAYAYQDSLLYEESIPDFEKSYSLVTTVPEVPFYFGYTHYNLGNYDEALKLYTDAIKIDSNYASAFDNRARTHVKLENYDEAARDFSSSLELFPNDAQIYQERAEVYLLTDNKIKACADLRIAKELGSDVDEIITENCTDE